MERGLDAVDDGGAATPPAKRSAAREAFDRAREWLTLEERSARARTIDADTKRSLAADLARGRDLRRAAEVLWDGRCASQAYRLATEALDALGSVRARATKDAPSAEVVAARDELASLGAPADDARLTTEHVLLFSRLVEACASLERDVEAFAASDEQIAATRLRRRSKAAAIAFVALVSLTLFVLSRFRIRAVASAAYSPSYEAANVLDHNTSSEWLLPDRTLGWLDLHLSPSRTVTRLRLVNAHNHNFDDRATKDFTVELYSHDHLVKSVDAGFAAFDPDPPWTTIELGRNPGIDRVRIVIKSYFLDGAGLGEVSVE